MHRVSVAGKHKTGSARAGPKPHRSLSLIFLGLLIAGFLAGCANGFRWSTPDPTIVELRLSATNLLNPDRRGRASPLLVRLYELNAVDVFTNADVRFEAMPGTRFLAVFAAYRKLDSAQWRDWVAVPLNIETSIALRFDAMEAGFTIEVE